MTPPSKGTQWANFLERVLWTLLQVATAEGIVQVVEEVAKTEVAAIWTVVLATVLAAVKNAATQAFGSPTGATLPEGKAPVPAEKVVALKDDHAGVVAGYAPDALQAKEPVRVIPDQHDQGSLP